MTDSEKIINSLHVGMDPNEVSKRLQQIKVGELSPTTSHFKGVIGLLLQ